jgi:hypothetical protein
MGYTEKITLDIFLRSRSLKSKNKNPRIGISINSEKLDEFEAVPDEVGITKVSYSIEVPEGENILAISLLNKESDKDTVVNDNGEITDDLNCEILGVTIEGVELDNLVRAHGTYYLNEPVFYNNEENSVLPGHTFLSWNGTFKFRFSSPLYIWLLENV